MLKLSDSELDKLSREAAEKFEPADNVQSWNRLEQLLDKHLGKPAPIPKTIRPGTVFLYSGAMLVVVCVTYFLINSKKNNHNSTHQISTITTRQSLPTNKVKTDSAIASLANKDKSQSLDRANDKSSGQTPRTPSVQPDSRAGSAGAGKQVQTSSSTNNLQSSDKASSGASAVKAVGKTKDNAKKLEAKTNEKENVITRRAGSQSGVVKNSVVEGRPGVDKENRAAPGPNKSGHSRTNQINGSSPAEKKGRDFTFSGSRAPRKNNALTQQDNQELDAAASKDNEAGSGGESENLHPLQTPGVYEMPRINTSISDSALQTFNDKSLVPNIINPRRANHAAYVNRSLQIGILAAPEFSRVKYIYDNNKIGNNFGVTLSYSLFGPLSVNTGVLFAKKYYQAGEEQFHAPQGAAPRDAAIEFVNASTNMIDIPLNLRYNYFSDGNSSFFVNGGLSSYLIEKQNFNYYCVFNNAFVQYSRWVQPQTPPTSKTEMFSIVNFSTGFETAFNNSFSFQFEPYVKIPVRGIGFGKVNLNSYGISISVKYAPVLGRGRH